MGFGRKKFGEGRRVTLRLKAGVDESLGMAYEACKEVRRGGSEESLNDFINRLLFEKSEEMLMISRRSRELRGVVGGDSEADRRIRMLRDELGR